MTSTASSAKPTRQKLDEQIRLRFQSARQEIIAKIIDDSDGEGEIDITDAYSLSTALLGKYVTLDWPHWRAIRKVRTEIARYAGDRTRRRPLNIMMQAEPGSGKSHLVRCLANSLSGQNASAVDFNLASLQQVEDLIQPLDAVRNLKVADRLPILFLDEFDSDPGRYPLLLPLLWDGELNIAHRNLKLGKLVIILAGSQASVTSALAAAKTMRPSTPIEQGKLVDLLSRINGGELEIPPLDLIAEDRDRRADKVCLAISLLQSRFGDSLEVIPISLLHLVAVSTFRYGVRSLAHLMDYITPPTVEGENEITTVTAAQLRLPLTSVTALRASSLSYHMYSADGPAAIVDTWKSVSAKTATVRIQEPASGKNLPLWIKSS